jgi:hypothetical protein
MLIVPTAIRRVFRGLYAAAGALIVGTTVAAAANMRALGDFYAWASPALRPLAALPWVREVAAQSHKFPLAEAHAVLVLACLVVVLGTAWLGALRALRETVMFAGTDLASLRSALRENFFISIFVPPTGWRSNRELALPEISPGDAFFLEKRAAGIDDLLIRYYTHKSVLPGFLVVILIAAVFFLFPDLIDGSRRSEPAWFFFGRVLVAVAATYSFFALLLFLSAHLSRSSSGYRPSSNT